MHVGPVIAVTDLARTRRFYEGALELDDHETPGGWVVSADEGTVVYVLADIPDAGSATWPVASFRVANVRAKGRTQTAPSSPSSSSVTPRSQ